MACGSSLGESNMGQSEAVIQLVCEFIKYFFKIPNKQEESSQFALNLSYLSCCQKPQEAIVLRIKKKSWTIEQFHCLASWSYKSNTWRLRSGLWIHLKQENARWVLQGTGAQIVEEFWYWSKLDSGTLWWSPITGDCSIRLLFKMLELFFDFSINYISYPHMHWIIFHT